MWHVAQTIMQIYLIMMWIQLTRCPCREIIIQLQHEYYSMTFITEAFTLCTHAYRSKYTFNVACYMLELYNDRLIDLFSVRGKEISLQKYPRLLRYNYSLITVSRLHCTQQFWKHTWLHLYPAKLEIKKDKKVSNWCHAATTCMHPAYIITCVYS